MICSTHSLEFIGGVHLGPLSWLTNSSVVKPYLTYFENAAAQELFEFQVRRDLRYLHQALVTDSQPTSGTFFHNQDTESVTSKRYAEALSSTLDAGTKYIYVSSLADQVVPVYSAIHASAHHPNILRAMHVDGAAYQLSRTPHSLRSPLLLWANIFDTS